MTKAFRGAVAPTIKYLSINGPSALERLPAGQTSILLLDANVFAYLLTHRKSVTAYSFSHELDEMLRLVHRRQIRVDASFAAMERALDTSKLIAAPEDFARWFDDFYEGKALFKTDALKPATGPLCTPMNFAITAFAWEGTFLPAYATLLKAVELATKRSKRNQCRANIEELFDWCRMTGVAPGLAGNLAIGLFAKEPSAIATLKYNGGDDFETMILRAHNAARDVMYYVRLLEIQHNLSEETGGGALYATADAGIFQMVKLNKLDYWSTRNGQGIYTCAVYPELDRLLSDDEREAVTRPAYPSAAYVPLPPPTDKLTTLIAAMTASLREEVVAP